MRLKIFLIIDSDINDKVYWQGTGKVSVF